MNLRFCFVLSISPAFMDKAHSFTSFRYSAFSYPSPLAGVLSISCNRYTPDLNFLTTRFSLRSTWSKVLILRFTVLVCFIEKHFQCLAQRAFTQCVFSLRSKDFSAFGNVQIVMSSPDGQNFWVSLVYVVGIKKGNLFSPLDFTFCFRLLANILILLVYYSFLGQNPESQVLQNKLFLVWLLP